MAGAVEIRCGACPSVEGDDDRAWFGCLGDESGHRHAVDEDDA
jgi:hypothetical protein